MKKVSLVLIFTLLISCFAGVGVSAVVNDEFLFEGYYGDGKQSVTSAAAWGNHLFVAAANGLQIYNINTNELEATWNLKSNSIIPTVGSSFVPSQTVVTENYIVVLSTQNSIAVFPNEGVYTDTPPKLIRRLGLFNNQPRMVYENGYLYVLDQVGAATVRGDGKTTYSVEAGSIVLWKIDINNIENFAYAGAASLKYSALNVASMISQGYARLIDLGKRDYYWGQIAVENGKLYTVTYNDTITAPYKTLYLHNIDLEAMESKDVVVSENTPAGLSTAFFTETGVVNQIKALEVYEVDNPDNRKAVSDFGRNVQVSCIEYTDGSFYTTVYFKNVEDFENYFGASEDELASGSKKFAIDYKEEVNQLIYSKNTESLNVGALAVKDGKAILMTGNGQRGQSAVLAQPNYTFIVDGESGEVLKDFYVNLMPDNGNGKASAVQSAVVVGDYLVYFVKQVANHAAVLDLTDIDNFNGSVAGTINIPAVISTSSVLSQAFVHGGYIYYPTANRIAAVSTTLYANKLYAKENVTKFPMIITGVSSEGRECGSVTVSVGQNFAEANAAGGAYSLNVLSAANGEYEITAGANGDTLTKTVIVDVPDAAQITNIETTDGIKFNAVNNTDKYISKTESITFVAVAYDKNGKFIDMKETTKSCKYGESTAVTIAKPETEDGGYILIYPFSGSVLIDVPVKTDGSKTAERTVRFAQNAEITASAVVNAADKTVTVTGQYIPGADLFAETVKDEIDTVDVRHIRVSRDGSFEYEYDYADDVIAGTSAYALTLTDIAGSKTVDFECSDSANFENAMKELKDSVSSGSELSAYFAANPDVASALGIDIDNENYALLSSSNKAEVMNTIYKKIAESSYTGLKSIFEAKTAEAKNNQEKSDALEAVKSASASTLTGVLEKYKSIYGISESLWGKYTSYKEKKIAEINTYFLKKTVNELEDVPKNLSYAIDKANQDQDDPVAKPSGGNIKNQGKYEVTESGNNSTVPPVVTPIEGVFDDIDSVPWAKDSIETLAKKDIISGIGNRVFAPNDYVTREQMVKLLIEAFDKNTGKTETSFRDVAKDAWYTTYIASAEEIGLAKGDGYNFGVGSSLTRQDMAVMAYRMMEIAGAELSGEKTEVSDDSEIAEYAKEAVYAMQAEGIISGTGDGVFSPKMPCTRAMAAKVIYEIMSVCGR